MREVIYILGLLLLSAFFSASEIAYSSINKVRLETMQDEKNKKATMAYHIYLNYERALATILVGNNLVNIAASTLATYLALELVGAGAVSLAALIMTLLVLIFGEITPKIMASKHSLPIALFASYPLRIFMVIFSPVLFFTQPLVELLRRKFKGEELDPEEQSEAVEEELVSLLETVEHEGVIDEKRKNIISSAIDFAEKSVGEILMPRVDIYAIDLDDEREEILEAIQASPYTRIPIYEKSIDNIVGILYLNHFYRKIIDDPNLCIRDILKPAIYFYKTTRLPAALEMLRQSQMHLGVVTDEYGANIGIVTIEDIMETLVGEIWDETDEVYDEIIKLGDSNYELDGDVSIGDLLDLVQWEEEDFDFESDTVGGWCIEELQGYPRPGDSFQYENVRVKVLTMDNLRVDRVQIDIEKNDEEDY